MILCFLLSVNTTAATANSGLIPGIYKNKTVFYRENPPPPIVASAKDEPEANGYLKKLEKTVPKSSAPAISLGSFLITGNESLDRGQLVVYSKGTDATAKRYKAFINERASINDVKATDLDYFSNLFDNKDNDKVVKWSSTSASPSAATATPQPTAEEKQAQIRNLKQGIVAIKQEIQAIRLASGSQSYVASIQQQKEVASNLNPDTVEQTPEAFAAVRDTLVATQAKILEINSTETNRLVEINKEILDLVTAFNKEEYKEPNQTERLVNYARILKGRNPDTALAILKIIDSNKKPKTIDDMLREVNTELGKAGYPKLEFSGFTTKHLQETVFVPERSILGKNQKL